MACRKTYYECHITMLGNRDIIKEAVEKLKWKFSAIDGDILMGDGVKLYATRHFNSRLGDGRVVQELLDTAAKLEKIPHIAVTRRKVEKVIWDDRSAKVGCKGGCLECHMDDLEVFP